LIGLPAQYLSIANRHPLQKSSMYMKSLTSFPFPQTTYGTSRAIARFINAGIT
jgi:hypothetical protein